MQLTGTEFTKAAAAAGNDISTFPDFPAEIRAPAGSLAGVSGFQLHFASSEIYTPGDAPDVLVAMNPAALRANLSDLVENGILIVNTGTFTPPNLKKAGYEKDPLADETLRQKYRLHGIDISKLTNAALDETDLSTKEKGRCKNFFALGLMFWAYSRDPQTETSQIQAKFSKDARLADANVRAFKAGYHYGETAEMFQDVYRVEQARFDPGTYRNITGNEAIALGLVAGAHLAGKPLFYSGYPITPASSLLHYLSNYKNHGVTTFQAEDEIAGIGAAIGAAYGGALAVTASSGPGISLKAEGMALAAMTELPMVIVSIQRGGPFDGAADQDRAVRPAAGAVRPQRRLPAAGHRRLLAGRCVRGCDPGRAARGQVRHAGDPPVRRLPGQRLGAVAPARRGRDGAFQGRPPH